MDQNLEQKTKLEKDNRTTTDRDKIKRWITERKGRPTLVKSPKRSIQLRIDFGESDDELEEISWDEFFRIFDNNNLALVYEEYTKDNEISRFYKFTKR